MMDRRNLLSHLAQFSALGAISPRASALTKTAAQPHFFVFLQMSGAWDICLAFDPKDRDSKLPNGEKHFDQPYEIADVKSFGEIKLGPAGKVLAPFADKMTIINGVHMETEQSHTARAVMSGSQTARSSNSPFVQAILASHHPFVSSLPIPHLYGSYSDFGAGPYSNFNINSPLQKFAAQFDSNQQKVDEERDKLNILQSLSSLHLKSLKRMDDKLEFSKYLRALKTERQVLGISEKLQLPTLADAGVFSAPSLEGDIIAKLFRAKMLGSFTLELSGKYLFDTHANHFQSHPLEKALKDAVDFMNAFKKVPYDHQSSIFDHTTFVMNSEFCRTPKLNAINGKDHHLETNSFVFIGKNVQNNLHGQSNWRKREDKIIPHTALPVDLKTGKPKADGHLMVAKDVWAGSEKIFGVDLRYKFDRNTKPIEFL